MSQPADGDVTGQVALGAEISQDRSRCAIVAAGRSKTGRKVAVDLVFYDHPGGAVARLEALYAKHDPVAVVIDGRSQAATLLTPLAHAGIVVTQPSAQELAAATGDISDLVNLGGLEHLDQPPPTSAVRAAVRRVLARASAWERRVPVDQAPWLAATLAAWGYLKWEAGSDPGVWVLDAPGSRDIGAVGWTDGVPPWVKGDAAWNGSRPPWEQRL
jgi:hypothetical protein